MWLHFIKLSFDLVYFEVIVYLSPVFEVAEIDHKWTADRGDTALKD